MKKRYRLQARESRWFQEEVAPEFGHYPSVLEKDRTAKDMVKWIRGKRKKVKRRKINEKKDN
ncbi:hypothetical protein P4475_07645 [Halalkalibacterium halodurans]|uniref:hypothetical protein n=1 Tax=Halalkalibacterium halodurans TaxID=86665 RepID=UPI0010680BD6|nr:hypothetical protein [Halalkalibacterium halodurans]MED3646688.1 hypothetical protein [Halalkalibacterium halodurans]TES54489.1 hypothetical protein E2L07_09820 [Halalkalibacterium halodurans]